MCIEGGCLGASERMLSLIAWCAQIRKLVEWAHTINVRKWKLWEKWPGRGGQGVAMASWEQKSSKTQREAAERHLNFWTSLISVESASTKRKREAEKEREGESGRESDSGWLWNWKHLQSLTELSLLGNQLIAVGRRYCLNSLSTSFKSWQPRVVCNLSFQKRSGTKGREVKRLAGIVIIWLLHILFLWSTSAVVLRSLFISRAGEINEEKSRDDLLSSALCWPRSTRSLALWLFRGFQFPLTTESVIKIATGHATPGCKAKKALKTWIKCDKWFFI